MLYKNDKKKIICNCSFIDNYKRTYECDDKGSFSIFLPFSSMDANRGGDSSFIQRVYFFQKGV